MTLARCQLVIQDENGNIVDGASVTVQAELPGAPLVQLYSDRDGAVAIGNPFTAADGADAGFHVLGGAYKITATSGAFTRVWRYVGVGTAQEVDGSGFTPRGEYDTSSPGTEYHFLDIVTDQDSSWLYINSDASTGNAPPTLPTTVNSYWQLLASKSGFFTGSESAESTLFDEDEFFFNRPSSPGGTRKITKADLQTALIPTAREIQINGNIDVSQELGTTGATLVNNTIKYIADCWQSVYNNAAAVVTSAQLAAASFPSARPGFSFGLQMKATTALSSLANGDFALFRQSIEGYRAARLGWGAAGAETLQLGFYFYATASGTAFVRVVNSANNRAYHAEFSVASGWQWVNVEIPGDTTGTWLTTTGVGVNIDIFLAGKAASPATPGAWGTTPNTQTTNSTNLLGTNNNVAIVTGFVARPGSLPPTAEFAQLSARSFAEEIALCRRYFHVLPSGGANAFVLPGGMQSGTNCLCTYFFPVEMRAAPTLTAAGVASDYYVIINGTTIDCTTKPSISITGTQMVGITFPMTASVGFAAWGAPKTATGKFSFNARL